MTDRGRSFGTYSGTKYYPLDPKPEEVNILDIAQSLANQCRYAGHCQAFYSIAEHSVRVAHIVLTESRDAKMALQALLHDASEAYLVDVPRPVKYEPVFREMYAPLEQKNHDAVMLAFNLPPGQLPPFVSKVDDRLLATEAMQMMRNTEDWVLDIPYPDMSFDFLPPHEARTLFLATFNDLWTQINGEPFFRNSGELSPT